MEKTPRAKQKARLQEASLSLSRYSGLPVQVFHELLIGHERLAVDLLADALLVEVTGQPAHEERVARAHDETGVDILGLCYHAVVEDVPGLVRQRLEALRADLVGRQLGLRLVLLPGGRDLGVELLGHR